MQKSYLILNFATQKKYNECPNMQMKTMIAHGKNIKIFAGNSHPALAMQDRIRTRCRSVRRRCRIFRQRFRFRSETVRGDSGSIPDPVYLRAGQRQPDGAAHHDRCLRPYIGRSYHCGNPRIGCGQDRKSKARDPISAKLVANLLTTAGADRILSRGSACNPDSGIL